MRWATRGTIVAAQEALEHGLAVNLGGGYHHAKPDRGEGFSIYADAGIAVASLRNQNLISETARIVCIDTDAHQGNGVCHTFMTDDRVFIFDIFNRHIYPNGDVEARKSPDRVHHLIRRCATLWLRRNVELRIGIRGYRPPLLRNCPADRFVTGQHFFSKRRQAILLAAGSELRTPLPRQNSLACWTNIVLP